MMDEEERKFRVELNYAARDYGFEDQMQRAKGFMLRHPKEWWCHVLPPGGRRYYLLSTPMGCILLRNGTTETLQLRNRRPEEGIPLDTILDVVLADDSLFVIDALCLGGDTEIWRRPYHDREQLISMFVNNTRGGGDILSLQMSNARHIFRLIDDVKIFESEDPHDFYFVRNRAKPTPSVEFHLTTRQHNGSAAPSVTELLKELRVYLHGIYRASKKSR
mmetsp:Transcript_32415/g.78905  ORF Transcript_32415/g.78905 Transcript_32415/m.78905 type:complete len:219 (+) Transcript_32415:279-935(+)